MNISKVHIRQESRSTGVRPEPNEDLKCLQQVEDESVVPEPKSPLRNLSYQHTGGGEGAGTPPRQDQGTSNLSTSREREDAMDEPEQRPADVLRVGKINITQTGPHEFNLLQRLDYRSRLGQQQLEIPENNMAATKTSAPLGREYDASFAKRASFRVLKSTTGSIDTLIGSQNGSQKQPIDANVLKRAPRNEELIGTNATVESS